MKEHDKELQNNPTPTEPRPAPVPRRSRSKKKRKRPPISPEQRRKIVEYHKMGFGQRRIEKMVGLGRKRVRGVLDNMGLLDKRVAPSSTTTSRNTAHQASKLDPFREQIKAKVQKNLTTVRILREIGEQGYEGGRTILSDYVRSIRVTPPKKKVWRRFETRPGEETQYDWSPYRVPLGGTPSVVHAFAATLGFSRKTYLQFFHDERTPTLLEAHVGSFADFKGVTRRGVYDWMATVVLGTVGPDRKPLWNPRFLEFCRYYGFEPYLCKVRDPDRKGKDERFFYYMERDFLRGSTFDSLEDLNRQARLWLDEVANRRVHGTTRRVPDEAWEQERPFLITLPDSPYPACDEQLRQVGPDSVISVRGTPYTVPASLAHQNVMVRLYAEHFEVLDRRGQVAFNRRYVPAQDKGKLVIDPAHYDGVRPRGPVPGGSVAELEEALLKRFPVLAELFAGIRLRMKSLSHVHLRALWRLADRYGVEAFLDAAARAQAGRRFNANAVRRILERDHPLADEPEPPSPLTAAARVLVELGDVDSGSLSDYAELDSYNGQGDDEPKGGDDHGQ